MTRPSGPRPTSPSAPMPPLAPNLRPVPDRRAVPPVSPERFGRTKRVAARAGKVVLFGAAAATAVVNGIGIAQDRQAEQETARLLQEYLNSADALETYQEGAIDPGDVVVVGLTKKLKTTPAKFATLIAENPDDAEEVADLRSMISAQTGADTDQDKLKQDHTVVLPDGLVNPDVVQSFVVAVEVERNPVETP